MTPAARVAAAAEILDTWRGGDARAEAVLRAWGRANRFAGSKDRRAISDIVFDCIRRRRSYGWLTGGGEDGRALTLGRAIASGDDPAAVFSGEGHAPAALSPDEARLVQGAKDLADAPDAVRFDVPDWLEASLRAALGDEFEAAMTAGRDRAPVDLRVNRIKASHTDAMRALAQGTPPHHGEAVEGAAHAIRLPPGAAIANTAAYLDGLVELQDAASQMGAALAAPKPGEVVLDYCAGGGGKALAFASLMGGEGRVIAHDIAPGRMKDIPARAARAGAAIEIARSGDALKLLTGACDLVFVDAPCSGAGVWRRDPEAKWRLTPDALSRLQAAQSEAVSAAMTYLRPGGRLAYATCSILEAENDAQVNALAERHAGLTLTARRLWTPGAPGDGFFCAVMERGAE